MNGFASVVEPIARHAAAIVVNALWEDAVIFFAMAFLLRIWRSVNAATRYAAWCIALVAAVAVPLLTTHAAPQSVRPAHVSSIAHVASGHVLVASNGGEVSTHGATVTPPRESSASQEPISPFRISVPNAVAFGVAALWALAAAYFMLRLLVALARLERLKRNALPLPMEFRDALERWNAATPQARGVRLCVSDETEVPVAVGLFDAMILIPRTLLASLAPEEIEQIYLHERAHLRRADDWTNLLQRVATALAWFSPGMYAMARALDLEREVACDDDVVARTGAVRPYARCLTHMAEITAWPHQPLAAPGAFVTRRGISERIERLLSAGRSAARGLSLAPTALALAIVGALALAMPALAVTLAAPVTPVPPPTTVATPAPPSAVGTAAPAARSLPRVRSIHVHVHPHRAYVPTHHVYVPPQHVHVPAQHVYVPATHVHVRVPPVNVDVPGMNLTVPAIDVDVPAVSVDVPDDGSPSCRSACDFSNVRWPDADFAGRSLSASDFDNADLRGANFSNARLQEIDFSDADLRHANFDGARLSYVDFSDARLDGATFAGATIDVCDFSDADLTGVDLSRAHLDDLCRRTLSNP